MRIFFYTFMAICLICCSSKNSENESDSNFDFSYNMDKIDQNLKENISKGDFRAMAVMGQGRIVPGFNGWEKGSSPEIEQHEKRYGLKIIEEYSDVRSNKFDSEYQNQIFKYAELYNIKLVEYLNHQGAD